MVFNYFNSYMDIAYVSTIVRFFSEKECSLKLNYILHVHLLNSILSLFFSLSFSLSLCPSLSCSFCLFLSRFSSSVFLLLSFLFLSLSVCVSLFLLCSLLSEERREDAASCTRVFTSVSVCVHTVFNTCGTSLHSEYM